MPPAVGPEAQGLLPAPWLRVCAWITCAGGPEEVPCARSSHTATAIGPALLLLGGTTPLGPQHGLHFLTSPPVTAGEVQRRRLAEAEGQLALVRGRLVEAEAGLAAAALNATTQREEMQVCGCCSRACVALR